MPQVSTPFVDKSITSDGTSQALFAVAPYGGINERVISNPHATNTIWLNLVGGAAAANAVGCVPLGPLQTLAGSWVNATTALATVGTPITALER